MAEAAELLQDVEDKVLAALFPAGSALTDVGGLPSPLRLFQSVAQCCMGQKQAQQVMEGTGAS